MLGFILSWPYGPTGSATCNRTPVHQYTSTISTPVFQYTCTPVTSCSSGLRQRPLEVCVCPHRDQLFNVVIPVHHLMIIHRGFRMLIAPHRAVWPYTSLPLGASSCAARIPDTSDRVSSSRGTVRDNPGLPGTPWRRTRTYQPQSVVWELGCHINGKRE